VKKIAFFSGSIFGLVQSRKICLIVMLKIRCKKTFGLCYLLICCNVAALAIGATGTQAAAFTDSLRTENYKNQRVIVYRVSAKETLYSVARKYAIKPAVLSSFNDNVTALKIGDEIRIPRGIASPAAALNVGSHTVLKGETLYSISLLYGMHVEELMSLNKLATNSVRIGDILKVKTGKGSTLDAQTSQKPELPATGLYIVQPHETLYAISARYGLQVSEVKELNSLANDDIHSGQTLKLRSGAGEPVSHAADPVSEPATKAGKPNKVQKEPVAAKKPDTATETKVAKKPEIVFTPTPSTPVTTEPVEKHVAHEYREDGMGTWLENNDLNQARSVALHHSAPVGTVLKVTNPASRKSVFVKVVGNFQENAENKNAVVIISKSAANLIGAVNQNFRVELSYAY